MKPKPRPAAAAAGLRRRAEARLRAPPAKPRTTAGERRAVADSQRLVHELQVHQVELEMQNAELQEARHRMEALLENYTDLYDFAPAGYFSLDEAGRILAVNLTGAAMLGVERPRLLNRGLTAWVDPGSRAALAAFLARVFAGSEKQACEAALRKADGTPFWANIHGVLARLGSGPRKWCRLAVSDLTALKQAQAAERRAEALTATNLALTREIVRRQAVEEALQESERNQSRLLEQSRRLQEQLRQLSHQLLQAQEEERKRISRELHDDVTQTLVGIHVHLAALARKATISPRRLKATIRRTQRLVQKSVETVHQFARELRPAALDDLGLIATLHSFLRDFMKRTGIRVHFTTFAALDQLVSPQRTVVYRVVQAALSNVARHAHASQVRVGLRKRAGAVHLDIADNGKSFAVERVLHAKKFKRLGLLGMRERVEMIGGRFAVESAPGQGTTIRAQIPLAPGAS